MKNLSVKRFSTLRHCVAIQQIVRNRYIRSFTGLMGVLSLAIAFSVTAFAQDISNNSDAEVAQISVTLDSPSDQQIRDRITSIYEQLDQFQAIEISVAAGVVTVAGNVSNAAQAERALNLARRIEGVVTVEDNIERVLDVQGNVTPLVNQFKEDFRQWVRALPLFLLAMGVFFVIALSGHLLARWVSLWQRVTPNPFLAEIVTQVIRVVAVICGLVVALNFLGATTLMGTILGGAGVIGLAVGFAVRDTMENYISSIMLSLRQPFRANEHVVINEYEGRVVRLTSRATVLMTLDGNHLRIPNATVFKAVILNYSRNPERRFQFELGVDAEDDPLAAMETGLKAICSLDFVLTSPKPDAVINAVGDSNILITFAAWINQEHSDFRKARSLAIRAAKIALEQNGFTLPEPIYRLRFDQRLAGLLDGASGTEFAATVRSQSEASKEHKPMLSSTVLPAGDEKKIDVAPDMHIESIVDSERIKSSETDLLDPDRPIE